MIRRIVARAWARTLTPFEYVECNGAVVVGGGMSGAASVLALASGVTGHEEIPQRS